MSICAIQYGFVDSVGCMNPGALEGIVTGAAGSRITQELLRKETDDGGSTDKTFCIVGGSHANVFAGRCAEDL